MATLDKVLERLDAKATYWQGQRERAETFAQEAAAKAEVLRGCRGHRAADATVSQRIVMLLASARELAFSPQEIAAVLEVNGDTVRKVLQRLKEARRIVCRGRGHFQAR